MRDASAPVLGDLTNVPLRASADDAAFGKRVLKEHQHAAFASACSRSRGFSEDSQLTTTCPSSPRIARSSTSASLMSVDEDLNDDLDQDPQNASEYIPHIFRTLHKSESSHQPQPCYMQRQIHINVKMRAILIDWLVDVHKKYKLRDATLYLAVNLVDRYLEKRIVQRRVLQLVGVVAMLVAAKYEEIDPPQIQDFVYVSDRAYTREEVLDLEIDMLRAVEFIICVPTSVQFLERYQRLNGCSEAHAFLTRYLLELTLADLPIIRYTPSHVAAAAVLLSNKLIRKSPSWPPVLVRNTGGLSEEALKQCAKEICALLEVAQRDVEPERPTLQAVRKKYAHPRNFAVGRLRFPLRQPLDAALALALDEAAAAAAVPVADASRTGGVGAVRRGSAPAAYPQGGHAPMEI